MNAQEIALARRAVACKRWRWMPRMASVWEQKPEHGGHRIVFTVRSAESLYDDPWFDPERGRWELVGPDLSDPATLGCIENALVPEAWGQIIIFSCHASGSPWWAYRQNGSGPIAEGTTKAAAIVAALEAA